MTTAGLEGIMSTTHRPYATKQDLVAWVLREAILNGRLPPGQPLRQKEVSRVLGVSWTPVREAFRQLETEGWLTIETHRGAVVSPLSLSDFEDIYNTRIIVEPPASRLAAEHVDDETLARMELLTSQMSAVSLEQPDNWAPFLRLERELHGAMYLATCPRHLYEVIMNLRDASYRYLHATYAIPAEPDYHRRVHADLMDAFRRRDGAAAEHVMGSALRRVLTAVGGLASSIGPGSTDL